MKQAIREESESDVDDADIFLLKVSAEHRMLMLMIDKNKPDLFVKVEGNCRKPTFQLV